MSKMFKKASRDDWEPPEAEWGKDLIELYLQGIDGIIKCCHEDNISVKEFFKMAIEQLDELEWAEIKPTEYDPIQDESLQNPYSFLKDL